MLRNIRRILSLFTLIICGYLIIIAVQSMFGVYSNDDEIALSNVQGIIVQDSIIYIGIGPATNRIQEYTIEGRFIKNININGGNKKYTFKINDYGRPIISKRGYHDKKDFEKMKEVLSEKSYDLIMSLKSSSQLISPKEFTTKDGIKYYLIDHPFSNKLIREDLDGDRYEIINQNFYFKLQHTGYAHFLYFFVLMFFIVINAKQLGESMPKGKFSIWKFLENIFK